MSDEALIEAARAVAEAADQIKPWTAAEVLGQGVSGTAYEIPTDRVERLRVAVDAFRRIDRVSPTPGKEAMTPSDSRQR